MNYAEKKLENIDKTKVIREQFEEITNSLTKELKKLDKVNSVILFGSFARGDFSLRHSDIDIMIFLDLEKNDSKLEESILKKINKISIGKIISIHPIFQYKWFEPEDKSLLLTISDEGKTLFSKRLIIIGQSVLGLKSYYIIKFDTTGIDQIKKNKLHRFLHGYSVKNKKYKGIIDNDKVFATGKGAIIVPKELREKVLLFADSIGVKSKLGGKFYR